MHVWSIHMTAIVKWAGGLSFLGRGGTNHWVPMDAAKEVGGTAAASSPMELVLVGLGGCTAMDIVSILQKKKIKFDDFWIELDAVKADDYPKVFTQIKLKYVVVGKNVPRDAVERAVRLSEEKYCSVGAMLRKTAKIDYEIDVRAP
jgi:putative redox protein